MKKIIFSVFIGISLIILTVQVNAVQVLNIRQGGSATSTISANDVLFGSSKGVFMTQDNNFNYATTTDTLSLSNLSVSGTCTGCSSNTNDWIQQTNYGVLNLTASTTIPYWAKDAIYASSTLTVQGLSDMAGILSSASSTFKFLNIQLATTTEATSTFLSISNSSKLGTVLSGIWNGTTIGDAYLIKSGDWTGTFDGQEGTYYSNAINLTNFGTPFYTFFSATNTNALTEGANNLYWTNNRFDNRLSATTTLPNITTLLKLANATTSLLTVSNGAWFTDGNVGIGTTTPAATFGVSGGAYFDGTVKATSFTATSSIKILDEGSISWITGTTTLAFNIASTTLDASGKRFNLATSTFLLKNFPEPITMQGFYCKASTTGTALIRFGDGTNFTETGSCSTGAFTTTATNNAWTRWEDFLVEASSTAGTVNRITITTIMKKTGN